MTTSTREQRLHHVTQMRANFAIEDAHPDADDRKIQQRYIDGEIDLPAMLNYARKFAVQTKPSN